jgi:hypothetical protein
MAHSTLNMRHPKTLHTTQAPVGFSWTSLFFGPITCMFRSDWTPAVVITVLTIILIPFGISWGVWIVQAFFYNTHYVQKLVNQGYQVDHWEGDRILTELEMELGVRLERFQDSRSS